MCGSAKKTVNMNTLKKPTAIDRVVSQGTNNTKTNKTKKKKGAPEVRGVKKKKQRS